jgi:hypothetical protein
LLKNPQRLLPEFDYNSSPWSGIDRRDRVYHRCGDQRELPPLMSANQIATND